MPVSYTESILMQTALKIMVHILFSGYVDVLIIQTANLGVNAEDIFD
ncbi:MAG: hypothetical protein PHQ97_03720 [Desulfobacterales bacterium]|nr:hypothetical protein [Desulfobacterales bacterium]